MAKISIITLGCKVNQYESEWMKETLKKAGHSIMPLSASTEIAIINTCTVTSESDRKSRQFTRKVKRLNPNSKVIVLGCSSQLNPNYFNESDFVGGNREKKEILQIIEKTMIETVKAKPSIQKNYYLDENLDEMKIENFEGKTRAFVKIEDGCNQACTYCAIRFARGTKIRSKSPKIILQEINDLLNKGYKEIVLTGVNLGKYGEDIGTNLTMVLRKITALSGNFRIRLSSLNPDDITDELLELIANNPEKLCRHLHTSVQNGSNKILKLMNRGYTVEDFIDITERLRKIDPLFNITSDIIVGFPGESDEDFEQTLLLCSYVKFSKVHVFRFSPRYGTLAFKLWKKNGVTEKLVKERAKILNEHVEKMREYYLLGHLGKNRKVLIETVDKNIDGKIVSSGFDEYYIQHFINGIFAKNLFVDSIPISIDKKGVISRIACECERAMVNRGRAKNLHI